MLGAKLRRHFDHGGWVEIGVRDIGRGAELVRRNAEEVEKIRIHQRIHAELVAFQGRVGNLCGSERVPSSAAVVISE